MPNVMQGRLVCQDALLAHGCRAGPQLACDGWVCWCDTLCHRDRKKLPFFLYSYIDKDIVVGRGRGGGLAVWQRADKVGQQDSGDGRWCKLLQLQMWYGRSIISANILFGSNHFCRVQSTPLCQLPELAGITADRSYTATATAVQEWEARAGVLQVYK